MSRQSIPSSRCKISHSARSVDTTQQRLGEDTMPEERWGAIVVNHSTRTGYATPAGGYGRRADAERGARRIVVRQGDDVTSIMIYPTRLYADYRAMADEHVYIWVAAYPSGHR